MAGQQLRTNLFESFGERQMAQLTEGTLDLTMNSDTGTQLDLNILCFEFLEMQKE